jgi:pimeloyl-ACP methyl ester carboxylesterase
MAAMIWTTLLKGVLRAVYGPLPATGPNRAGGLVLVADGVGGLDLCGTGLAYVSARSGLPHCVHVMRWGHGFGRWHRDLTDVTNHEVRAATMVDQVALFRNEHPGAPVFLVGKSGGTGLVVRALEALPEGTVERAVLIAPALSPDYDLRRAIHAVRREVVVFWSPLDVFILGLGTRLFGTVDRVPSVAAGLTGFRMPPTTDPTEYARLRQVRWRPAMGTTGYFGGHVGPDNPRFLRQYVVPLLRVDEESDPAPARASSPRRPAPIT